MGAADTPVCQYRCLQLAFEEVIVLFLLVIESVVTSYCCRHYDLIII